MKITIKCCFCDTSLGVDDFGDNDISTILAAASQMGWRRGYQFWPGPVMFACTVESAKERLLLVDNITAKDLVELRGIEPRTC